jgi:hypothetical protein
VIPTIILCIGFIAVLWMILPDWTINRFFRENFWFILLAGLILGLTSSVLPDPKVPFKFRAAKWLQVSTVIILFFFMIFEYGYGRKIMKTGQVKMKSFFIDSWLGDDSSTSHNWMSNIFAGSGDTNSTFGKSAEALKLRGSTTYVAKWNSDGFKLANVFWAGNTTPDGVTASEANDMIMYCVVESGCNQFGTDGKPLRNIPNAKGEQSSAIGFYQIISGGLHNEFLDQLNAVPGHPSYDLNTLEGQFNFALALVKRRKAKGEPFDADWAVSREKLKTLQERIRSGAATFSDPSTLLPEEEPETAPPTEKKRVEETDDATPSGNCKEVVIETEFGVWSRWVEIGEGATLWSDGNIQIQDHKYRTWPILMHDKSSPYKITARTDKVQFQSFSGSPDSKPATVHLMPCK